VKFLLQPVNADFLRQNPLRILNEGIYLIASAGVLVDETNLN